MSKLYKLYQAVGNEAFSKKNTKISPYFRAIAPILVGLKPGYTGQHIGAVKMPVLMSEKSS